LTRLRILFADDIKVIHPGIRSILGERSTWKIYGEAATGAATIEKARRKLQRMPWQPVPAASH
jgi:DNA-binding NarL/FixJ family response regulator